MSSLAAAKHQNAAGEPLLEAKGQGRLARMGHEAPAEHTIMRLTKPGSA
jgi:hypothetical protein